MLGDIGEHEADCSQTVSHVDIRQPIVNDANVNEDLTDDLLAIRKSFSELDSFFFFLIFCVSLIDES